MDPSGKEKLEARVSRETLKAEPSKEKSVVSKEVEKKASELLSKESVEAKEGQEGAEFVEGKVSEVTAEDKTYEPSASGKKTYTTDEIETIRAKLLAALPPQDVMIKEIKRKLYKEEKELSKRMRKLQGHSHTHAFQLTIVVAQLRKIREYFSMLAHVTYEMVKHLWLKIVHGV